MSKLVFKGIGQAQEVLINNSKQDEKFLAIVREEMVQAIDKKDINGFIQTIEKMYFVELYTSRKPMTKDVQTFIMNAFMGTDTTEQKVDNIIKRYMRGEYVWVA